MERSIIATCLRHRTSVPGFLKGISKEGRSRTSFYTAPYLKYATGIYEQRTASGGLSYRLELLIKSRVCQGPSATEKAKVPVRGGDAPAPVYR